MKLWNIATIFAFGSSVTADFGSIRSIAEGRDELEAAGFTISDVLFVDFIMLLSPPIV